MLKCFTTLCSMGKILREFAYNAENLWFFFSKPYSHFRLVRLQAQTMVHCVETLWVFSAFEWKSFIHMEQKIYCIIKSRRTAATFGHIHTIMMQKIAFSPWATFFFVYHSLPLALELLWNVRSDCVVFFERPPQMNITTIE